MLFSAVHQVGVGYFNYRKNVRQYRLNKDKALWELKKGAMEELNALQTQLFNTSWALADRYSFPDEWRLTQPQFEKYTQTLQDDDRERMLERLDYLEGEFQVFPPFWYHKGKGALDLAMAARDAGDERDCRHFMSEAARSYEHFERVWKPIVRSDPYASSSALDQVALLNPSTDAERIRPLLDRVCVHAKHDLDVMQITAIHYLSIGEVDRATRVLRMLINEDRDVELNGKLLSRVYVEKDKDDDYDRLRKRIGEENVVSKLKPLSSIGGDLDELADAAEERAEVFAGIAGTAYANVMLTPLSDKIDNYLETDADEMSLEQIASHFYTEDIAALLDSGKKEADEEIYAPVMSDVLTEMECDLVVARRPLDERIGKTTAKYLQSIVDVELIGAELLGTQTSFLGSVAKGAAVGAAAGWFLGPLGVGAGIVGNLVHDHAKGKMAEATGGNFDKLVAKSVEEYNKMHERIADAAKASLLAIYSVCITDAKKDGEIAELREMIDGFTEAIAEAEAPDEEGI